MASAINISTCFWLCLGVGYGKHIRGRTKAPIAPLKCSALLPILRVPMGLKPKEVEPGAVFRREGTAMLQRKWIVNNEGRLLAAWTVRLV